jgi:SET domain-containing protein 6
VFVVDSSNDDEPEEMFSFVRLMMMSATEWEKTKHKAKLPKPKKDKVALSVTADVVRRRLAEYPTTIEASLSEKLSVSIKSVYVLG